MMTMFKAAGFGLLLFAAVCVFTPAGKYVMALVNKVPSEIEKQVPTKWEVAVLKEDLKQIGKSIDEQKMVVAASRVEVAQARNEEVAAKAEAEELGEQLTAISRDIDKNKGGSACEAVTRLKQKFGTKYPEFEAAERKHAAKQKKLAEAEKDLALATSVLTALTQAYQTLEQEVAELERQIRNVEISETRTRTKGSDTRMADVERRLAEIRKKVATRSERVKMDTEPSAATAETASPAEIDKTLKQWKARRAAGE